MAKIQNDKWYAWLLTPELWMLSNVEDFDYVSLYQKNVVAFDTKEEAARRLKDYVQRAKTSMSYKLLAKTNVFETRVGTGKELTVELVKDKLRRSHDG